MFYLNHAINPVVYNFVSTKFRTALKEICCRQRTGYTGYLSVTQDRIRCHETPSVYLSNARCTSTKHSRLSNKWMRSLNNDVNAYIDKSEAEPRHKYSVKERARRMSMDNSTSSCKDYDVKIRLENKTVAIKFNLKGDQDLKPVSI